MNVFRVVQALNQARCIPMDCLYRGRRDVYVVARHVAAIVENEDP